MDLTKKKPVLLYATSYKNVFKCPKCGSVLEWDIYHTASCCGVAFKKKFSISMCKNRNYAEITPDGVSLFLFRKDNKYNTTIVCPFCLQTHSFIPYMNGEYTLPCGNVVSIIVSKDISEG